MRSATGIASYSSRRSCSSLNRRRLPSPCSKPASMISSSRTASPCEGQVSRTASSRGENSAPSTAAARSTSRVERSSRSPIALHQPPASYESSLPHSSPLRRRRRETVVTDGLRIPRRSAEKTPEKSFNPSAKPVVFGGVTTYEPWLPPADPNARTRAVSWSPAPEQDPSERTRVWSSANAVAAQVGAQRGGRSSNRRRVLFAAGGLMLLAGGGIATAAAASWRIGRGVGATGGGTGGRGGAPAAGSTSAAASQSASASASAS